MRVYEFAKKINIPNKELIALLEDNGFSIKTHMSVLSDDAVTFLKTRFEKKEEKPVQKETIAPKAPQPPSERQKPSIISEPKKARLPQEEKKPELKKVFVIEKMTVGQVSERMNKPVSEVILNLLKQGVVCPKNQMLPEKTIVELARFYDLEVVYPEPEKAQEVKVVVSAEGTSDRLPIVVVLGHVDHGKTTLLDYVRKTRVAAREKGGITQHLGAYQVDTPQGGLVFIDTPGHAAFSNIRGRGVKVADLAILVVAADDGIMPQTIEALNKAKTLEVPIVVAINKVDKVEPARVEEVKNELSRYGLLPEDWGGDTIIVPISAKLGNGIDTLLEMVILQAQLMDLRTNLEVSPRGFILESKLEKGRGAVATVILQQGILRIGDHFSAGHTVGKVSSLMDSYSNRITQVGPSVPVQVAGFSELPQAGDYFEVVPFGKMRKIKAAKSAEHKIVVKGTAAAEALNLIIKTDTMSSKEALLEAIAKLSAREKASPVHIVHSGIGDISESDVTLAADTGSQLVGFSIKLEPNAAVSAQKNRVTIQLFDIIYKLLEYLEEKTKKEEKPRLIEKRIGEAVVRKVFNIKGLGVIAGSYVKEGIFSKAGRVVGWRGKEKIGEGPIKSLERDRKSVKEVHAGFEFAFLVDGIDDWQLDDRVECYLEVSEK